MHNRLSAVSLVCCLTFSSLAGAVHPSVAHSQTPCGSWDSLLGDLTDQRLDVEDMSEKTASGCDGRFEVSSNTGIFRYGGYTLEVTPSAAPENIDQLHWLPGAGPGLKGGAYLIPGLDLELQAALKDLQGRATLELDGSTGEKALAVDVGLFLIRGALALLPEDPLEPEKCFIPKESIALASISNASTLQYAANLLISNHLIKAHEELDHVASHFLDQATDTLKDSAQSVEVACAIKVVSKLKKSLGQRLIVAKLVVDYIASFGKWHLDYWQYQGEPSRVMLSYKPVRSGVIAYVSADQRSIWTVDPDGKSKTKLAEISQGAGGFQELAWSADGRRLAYTGRTPFAPDAGPGDSLSVLDVRTAVRRTVNTDSRIVGPISFFPDGKRLLAIHPSQENFLCQNQLVSIEIDTGDVTPLLEAGCRITSVQVTPDGSAVVLSSGGSDPTAVVEKVAISDRRESYIAGPGWQPRPSSSSLSPDGKRVVYRTTDLSSNGPSQIVIADADGANPQAIFRTAPGSGDQYAFSFAPDESAVVISRWSYLDSGSPSNPNLPSIGRTDILLMDVDGTPHQSIAQGIHAVWQPKPVALAAGFPPELGLPVRGQVEIIGIGRTASTDRGPLDPDAYAIDFTASGSSVATIAPGHIAYAGWHCPDPSRLQRCNGWTVVVDHGQYENREVYSLYSHLACDTLLPLSNDANLLRLLADVCARTSLGEDYELRDLRGLDVSGWIGSTPSDTCLDTMSGKYCFWDQGPDKPGEEHVHFALTQGRAGLVGAEALFDPSLRPINVWDPTNPWHLPLLPWPPAGGRIGPCWQSTFTGPDDMCMMANAPMPYPERESIRRDSVVGELLGRLVRAPSGEYAYEESAFRLAYSFATNQWTATVHGAPGSGAEAAFDRFLSSNRIDDRSWFGRPALKIVYG